MCHRWHAEAGGQLESCLYLLSRLTGLFLFLAVLSPGFPSTYIPVSSPTSPLIPWPSLTHEKRRFEKSQRRGHFG